MAPDKLSKQLAKYKSKADELETQKEQELADQKQFWHEINQQLHKENEDTQKQINELSDKLQEVSDIRQEEKAAAKASQDRVERKLENALQESARVQILYERVQLELGKLRKEKAELG